MRITNITGSLVLAGFLLALITGLVTACPAPAAQPTPTPTVAPAVTPSPAPATPSPAEPADTPTPPADTPTPAPARTPTAPVGTPSVSGPALTHPVAGFENCIGCHEVGGPGAGEPGGTGMPANHENFANEQCGACHAPPS